MTNFKTTLLTAVAGLGIATAGLFGIPSSAKAEIKCYDGQGYRMCFEQVAVNGQFNTWNVGIRNAYTDELMKVTCNGKSVSTWESEGGFNQSEAQQMADYFCSL